MSPGNNIKSFCYESMLFPLSHHLAWTRHRTEKSATDNKTMHVGKKSLIEGKLSTRILLACLCYQFPLQVVLVMIIFNLSSMEFFTELPQRGFILVFRQSYKKHGGGGGCLSESTFFPNSQSYHIPVQASMWRTVLFSCCPGKHIPPHQPLFTHL